MIRLFVGVTLSVFASVSLAQISRAVPYDTRHPDQTHLKKGLYRTTKEGICSIVANPKKEVLIVEWTGQNCRVAGDTIMLPRSNKSSTKFLTYSGVNEENGSRVARNVYFIDNGSFVMNKRIWKDRKWVDAYSITYHHQRSKRSEVLRRIEWVRYFNR